MNSLPLSGWLDHTYWVQYINGPSYMAAPCQGSGALRVHAELTSVRLWSCQPRAFPTVGSWRVTVLLSTVLLSKAPEIFDWLTENQNNIFIFLH